jgi:8-oxo-dGTP diphosphatase
MTEGATIATLCFLLRGTPAPNMILLGYKKRGFGAGKLAGLGGRVEAGERIAAAACREVYEEAGVILHEEDLRMGGTITFIFPRRPAWNQTVHLFVATKWIGEPTESEEMRPMWYALDTLPLPKCGTMRVIGSRGWLRGRHCIFRLRLGRTMQP